MKWTSLFLIGSISIHTLSAALGPVPAVGLKPPDARPQTPDPVITARGPDHKTWTRTHRQTRPDGRVVESKSSYTELATGMHFWQDGQWAESQETIELAPGGAVAQRGQHRASFAANLNTFGAIQVQSADHKLFRSHILGLAYTDAASGRSVLIAEIKDTLGAISGNQVHYLDAFTDIKANVRYTYTKAGFEQDVILLEDLPSPADYGLDPQTSRLEILTEFIEPPQPSSSETILKREPDQALRQAMVDPDLRDQTLEFGAMRIGTGAAFSLSEGHAALGETPAVQVGKEWTKMQGRDFLIEKVDYISIRPHVQRLPKSAAVRKEQKKEGEVLPRPNAGLMARTFPAPPKAAGEGGKMQMASITPPERGYVLDYSLVSSATNFVFKGDTTYFVNGAVNLSGTTVIEAGAVVKYTNGASVARLVIQGPIDCRTTPYRPAVFTAKDDDSVGEIISGSTGQPANYYASHAFYISDTVSAYNLHDLRVCWANQAFFRASGTPALTLSHSQIQDCNRAFGCYYTPVRLRNVLLHRIKIGYYGNAGIPNIGEHVTYHVVGFFLTGAATPPSLTNCLLISVTNTLNFSGANNANSLSDSGIFATVGGAAHYLAAGSPHRDAGTVDINPNLAADLKKRTTFPPLVYSNAVISTDTTFAPQAGRDSGVPDLGYHYDPLDYAFGGVTANANVTFAPGTAVGWFRTSSGWYHAGHGLQMDDQKVATFDGRVDQPAWWVRCSVVQEGASALWAGGYGPGGITGWADQNLEDVTLAPEIRARFTRFSVLACDSSHFRDDWGYLIVRATDCEFWGGATAGYVISCYFTNCFLDRVYGGQVAGLPGNEIQLRNCTWRGGLFQLNRSYSAIPVSIRDTAFDGTSFDVNDAYAQNPSYTDYDYNAFLTGSPRTTPPGANDVLVGSFNWQTGPLGGYYLPAGSALINAGSQSAAASALFHYTTTTDQAKEAASTVDIGLHWLALNGQSQPMDADGEGLADYLEDANGNGNQELTETSITSLTQTETA